jgi:hypothetical protein
MQDFKVKLIGGNIVFEKYIKNSIEVEAIQFTDKNKDKAYAWVSEIQMNIQPSFDDNNKPCLIIPTLEGEMTCSLDDYLIKEPFPTDWRKFYPCKEEIFNKTYSKVLDVMTPQHKYVIVFDEEDSIQLNIDKNINRPNQPDDHEIISEYVLNNYGYKTYEVVALDDIETIKIK